ncbi:IS66 family insertion sequence element accessory protein TnpA [Marinomonas sp.]|uniref:IS66 family insertion sequence element accessory protein TnpA n=1 Tax=Marinomonas sp. TaxID=1904862 RepID=UPI003BAC784C
MNQPSDSQSRSEFWLEQVKVAGESGLSGAQFCKQQDLNYSQFMYWRQKCQKQSNPTSQGKASGFVKVAPSILESPSSLSVSLPSGIQIRGIDSGNLALVRQLLEWAS